MMTKTLLAVATLAATTVGIAQTASAAPIHEAARVEVRERTFAKPIAVRETARPIAVRETARPIAVRENARPIIERGHGPVVVAEHTRPRPVIVENRAPVIIHDRGWVGPRDHWMWRDGRYVLATDFIAPVYVAPFASGSMYFNLGGAAGNVELESNGGATYVNQVTIAYADGSNQVINVNQEIDGNLPMVDLATNGAPIAGVTVFGQGAALTVLAQ